MTDKINMVDADGRSLEVGDEVCVVGGTKSNLSRGYIREFCCCDNDPRSHAKVQARVYFPGAKLLGGGWTSIDLRFVSRSK